MRDKTILQNHIEKWTKSLEKRKKGKVINNETKWVTTNVTKILQKDYENITIPIDFLNKM